MEDKEGAQLRRSRMSYYDRGPGPAGFGPMPPLLARNNPAFGKHAVTHNIAPEYSFRLYLGSSFLSRNIGPGAAGYWIEYGQKANGMYRYGLEKSMGLKLKDLRLPETPGPGAYTPAGPASTRYRPPSWTMRIRTPELYLSRLRTPAPNTYLLPPTIGERHPSKHMVPATTMKGARTTKRLPISPGPKYDVGKVELIKSKAPAYTMRIKWPNLTGLKVPGPAHYDCTKADSITPRVPAPAYSFGVQYSDFTALPITACDRSKYEFYIC